MASGHPVETEIYSLFQDRITEPDLQDEDMPDQPATPAGPRRRRRRRGGSRPGSSEPPTS